MSDCERLSDRMPEVALLRAAWSAEEAAHLASCADCRAEWDLVLAAHRLEASAPSVDPATMAAAVQHRLASERMADRRGRWGWALGGLAAAAEIGSAEDARRSTLEFQVGLVEAAGIAGLLGLILGITIVTTEFRHGTITPTFLAAPVRERHSSAISPGSRKRPAAPRFSR